jgi:uncharacterized membrane protein YbhN (UPF0104 family)
MTAEPVQPDASRSPAQRGPLSAFWHRYGWWLVKNVLGWLLIVVAPVIGAALPGPGGIPLFIVGFALVSFPGKRHLTARVFRGMPIDLSGNGAGVFSGMTTVLLPLVATLLVRWKFKSALDNSLFDWPYVLAVVGAALAMSYLLARLGLRLANVAIRRVPAVRRKVRPAMRAKGIDLLPPRRRKRLLHRTGTSEVFVGSSKQSAQAHDPAATAGTNDPSHVDHEIIEIRPSFKQSAARAWKRAKPWLRRSLGLALVVVIFWKMIKPVAGNWHQVSARIMEYDIWRFGLAVLMFAVFLFAFRNLIWLKMIKGFGYRIPLAAGTRVWSTGELARYLPGTIWQVLGRVYLIKPYGVPASVCSTTQILDIATFLLANIVLGLSCVLWFFQKAQPDMRWYLWGAMAFVPLLGLGLHPKIFYGIAGRILTKLGKPAFTTRLSGRKLAKYFLIYLGALLFQSLAIWVLLGDALQIKIDHWWALAGPYCLAWSAGFVVGWWSPGGLGVREVVFVGLLKLTLGAQSKAMFPDDATLLGFLVFCSVLLRLWTISGELVVASLAYLADYKGALNHPDARGRVQELAPGGN